MPELVLDFSDVGSLPAHLPRRLSSLEFPHRNADAYLRDARLGDTDLTKTIWDERCSGPRPRRAVR